jgi:glycosyltransferase involved in cell wall biosynthesis
MMVPSTQEAFGQTASESLACGTPVVAFNATGLKDIVEHQKNGYLAQPFDSQELAQGIIWVLENQERHQKLCEYARAKAEQEFTLEMQARRYESLYDEIKSESAMHNQS